MEPNRKWLTAVRNFFFNKSISAFFLLAGGGILFGLLSSQKTVSDKTDAISLVKKGQQLWEKNQVDSAYAYFRQAQSLANVSHDKPTWAKATQLSGMYLSRQMRLEEASQTLDSVLAIGQELDSLNKDLFFARRERAYVDLMRNDIPAAVERYLSLVNRYASYPSSFDSLKAESRMVLGQAFFYQGNYEEGLKSSQKALAIYEQVFEKENMAIAKCLNTLAIMNMYSSQYQEALEHFQRAHDIMASQLGENHAEVIKVRTNIGVLYGELGLFWRSLEYHRENLPYLDSLPPSPHLNGYLNMASTLIAVGEYDEAWEYLGLAESFMEKYPGMTPENQAYIILQRSIILAELDQHKKALKYAKEALTKSQRIYGGSHPALFEGYLHLGTQYLALDLPDSARFTFEELLPLVEEHLDPNALRRGHVLHYLGKTYVALKQWNKALRYYDLAQTAYLANGNRFDRAKAYAARAGVWRELGNWDSTLRMHQQAWEISMPDVPFQHQPDQTIYPNWRAHSFADVLGTQAKSFHERFETDQQIETLQGALAAYEAFLAGADSIRIYHQSAQSKSYWLQELLPMLEAAIEVAGQLYQETQDQSYLDKAFLLAEKSKAQNLRDQLRGRKAIEYAGVPDSLIQQEQDLTQRLAALDQAIYQAVEGQELTQLRGERLKLNSSYNSFLQQLEQQFPDYYSLKYPSSTLSVQEVQQALDTSEALYSYFWGKEYVLVFRLRSNELQLHRVKLEDNFLQALNTWLDFISHSPASSQYELSSIAPIGAQLTEILLPGIHSEIRHVTLIPHGLLGYLPFETLLRQAPESLDMRDWPFATQTWTMSYSAALELFLQQQMDGEQQAAYVGYAPNFGEGSPAEARSELGPLAFNQTEVENCASIWKGDALIGEQAQEWQAKQSSSEPLILHFATHAIADEEDLMQSRLYLEADAANREDGVLYAYEIYGLQFNSPLTILSACQTGQGPLQQGEGIMSLARAFQYGGSERVLTTLWQADDRSGAEITTAFLQGLEKGMPADLGLQQARKQWLNESDSYHCHPYFWAAYILIGEGGPITPKSQVPWGWILGLGSGMIVLMFVGYRFSKR